MKKTKRICTLLLAIVLTASMSLQPDIGRAFADNIEQTGQMTESAEKSASEAENAGESSEKVFYKQLMACSSLTDFEALLCDEENSAALDALTEEELNQLLAHVDEIWAAVTEPTEADTFLKEKALKKLSEYTDEPIQKDSEPAEKDSPAETKKKKAAAAEEDGKDEYIYFDLAAGDVTIGKDTYSGKVYVNGASTDVNGPHKDTNKYYVYQSNLTDGSSVGYYMKTGYETSIKDDNCRVPQYSRIEYDGKDWWKYITNNTEVKEVSENWDTAAGNIGRKETENKITFASESDYTADVTIDNIWSIFHKDMQNRTAGGIGANLMNTNIDCQNTHINLHLKGDNRVGCVHYSSGKGKNNTIEFNDGEISGTPGSITVADFKDNYKGNYWSSAIGGADNPGNIADQSDGIVINSGVIYAGTTSGDDCTAIGGGGNGFGGVIIKNGTVTAVSSSTGTAIGGGIGWSDKGGDANVTIEGGIVYAYNHGIRTDSGAYVSFVPAAAIGGGSASTNDGNGKTEVTIKGGTVYAQSTAGAAIGGGGSGTKKGGDATVNISGGTIIAKSVGGTVKYSKKNGNTASNVEEHVTAGVSIGGGTGATGGGSVTLNISKKDNGEIPILRTGSIGGGKSTGGKLGSANVTISGGDITGQVIMAGGGTEHCEFNMSGGRIHDTNVVDGNKITGITDPQADVPIKYIEDNGGAVFMDDPNGITKIEGGTIEGCKAKNGGAIWMNGGTANINGGTISNNTATENGGAVYLPGGDFNLDGGTIENNKALKGGGIFLSKRPSLKGGTISGNEATENGGGLYIEDSLVVLKPKASKSLSVKENKAVNGAGIYIHGTKSNADTLGDSKAKTPVQVDAITGATQIDPDASDLVGLLASGETEGWIYFTNNNATGNGGAVCVDTVDKQSRFELDTNNITVTGNRAKNGGGVAVLNGNFTMTAGTIGSEEENSANMATEGGGGVYVSDGDIWLKGGSIIHNKAKNGGGAYVAGNYNMLDGNVKSNTAEQDGGGIYVNDGTVTMYDGNVDSNTASEKGGGMHISSTKKKALVDIFSGSISHNKATSGGGVSVESTGEQRVDVTVGINHEHQVLNDGKFTQFEYPNNINVAEQYGDAHEDHNNHIYSNGLIHSSCPQVIGNTATDKGGGFYLSSSNGNTTIYCLQAEGNKAEKDEDSNCMRVNDGTLKIGDEDFDIHLEQEEYSGTKGNTTIEGTIMVKGGQVDVYGEMENPKFLNDVKVDVEGEGNHYLDHRLIDKNNVDYKVHYYENFKGDGNTPTGLYIARQYPDEGHVNLEDEKKYDFTIMPSIFSHPGYKIVGWNTKQDKSGDWYSVNGTYNLQELFDNKKLGNGDVPDMVDAHNDDYLFVLYAIWERSGYVLKFDPNVGEGETYTGTMENQLVTMGDKTQTIKKNAFKRSGYAFLGWTLIPTPSDTDTVYTDGHKIENDFTEEDGATVTLYAKWEKCNHEGYLVYTAEDNVLTQSCSNCGGHTATATISAVNCAYDGNYHLASVKLSDNWLGDKPEISYAMEDSDWDGKDSVKTEWKNNPVPVHAGTYTAKITGENDKGILIEGKTGATVEVDYIIERVKWETPAVPKISFKVQNKKGYIEITEPTEESDSTDAEIQYWIKNLKTDTNEEIILSEYRNWQDSNQFFNIAFANYYYFYAKRCEDRDHLESTPSRSEAYLATGGNIVYIKNDTGIEVVPKIEDGAFTYTVSAADGYHLRGYNDNLSDDEMIIGPDDDFAFVKPIEGVSDAKNVTKGIIINRNEFANKTYKYSVNFNKDVAYYQVTLEFSGAAKDASVAHKVTDGQVFRNFNNKETSISRDSAFTAQFTVSDYIPDEYINQELRFSEGDSLAGTDAKMLPAGTTVIMKTDDGKYWYYKLAVADDSIDLTGFTAMGGMDEFSFNTTDPSGKNFTYQFIVDFSQVAKNERIDTETLEVSLGLTATDSPKNPASEKAPTIPADGETHISLDIKPEATFTLSGNPEGKSATLNCNYTASKGAASIWNGRNTALVLTAKEGATIPADLKLTATVDGSTTAYSKNSSNQFIIPLGKVATKENVKLTLSSSSFSSTTGSLAFTAKWLVSQSGAGKSPLNGYEAASLNENIKFSCQKDAVPSVRIDGEKHRCSVGGKLDITVNYQGIPSDGTITAYLQSKNDEQYIDTGAMDRDIFAQNNTQKKITFNMGQMDPGSYRILVIVQENGANLLQVPYYFVITN